MKKLVLIRHGESTWNKENRFTGWTDVDLSEKGVEEATAGGRALRDEGYVFDVAYTSVLKRAIKTLWIALEQMDQMWIPVHNTWRLNERHYGALQGLNKAETAAQARHGADQHLAPELRRAAAGSHAGRPAPPEPRSAVRGTLAGGSAADRVPEGHGGALPARLARDHRAGGALGPARAHRRARQQSPRARQVPRQHSRRGHRRPQHPDRASRSSTN